MNTAAGGTGENCLTFLGQSSSWVPAFIGMTRTAHGYLFTTEDLSLRAGALEAVLAKALRALAAASLFAFAAGCGDHARLNLPQGVGPAPELPPEVPTPLPPVH